MTEQPKKSFALQLMELRSKLDELSIRLSRERGQLAVERQLAEDIPILTRIVSVNNVAVTEMEITLAEARDACEAAVRAVLSRDLPKASQLTPLAQEVYRTASEKFDRLTTSSQATSAPSPSEAKEQTKTTEASIPSPSTERDLGGKLAAQSPFSEDEIRALRELSTIYRRYGGKRERVATASLRVGDKLDRLTWTRTKRAHHR